MFDNRKNPYKRAKDLWTRLCPQHRNHLERVDLEHHLKKKDVVDRVWKLFDPNESGIITRVMFKQGESLSVFNCPMLRTRVTSKAMSNCRFVMIMSAIVDMVNLRKSFTSTHKTFENAMAKLDMLFNIIVLLFVIVAFLIAFDVGVQQYAVSVSSVGDGVGKSDKCSKHDEKTLLL